MLPKKMLGKVIYKANLTGNNWMIKIGFEEPIEFVPGQYASIKVDESGLRRSYSVASLPGGKEIDLLVDVTPMGVGSKYILNLAVGDSVEVLGFLGRFVVDNNIGEDDQLLFVGNGTGIVPLRPMIEQLLNKDGFVGSVWLVWGMRYEEDLYWLKEIDNIHRDHENFRYEIVLSRPNEEWPGKIGHVGDVIGKLDLKWEKLTAYLCGSKEMVEEMTLTLVNKGVSEDKINFERFA